MRIVRWLTWYTPPVYWGCVKRRMRRLDGRPRLPDQQADVIVMAVAVKVLNFQPWGSNVDLFHPNCEI